MTAAIEGLLGTSLVNSLGWALLHSFWQDASVALLLAGALGALRRGPASARYLAACAALVLMVALPLLQFVLAAPPAVAWGSRAAPSPPTALVTPPKSSPGVAPGAADTRAEPRSTWTTSAPTWSRRIPSGLTRAIRSLLPAFVAAWLAGVVILSLRLLGGWLVLKRLLRRGTRPLAGPWVATIDRLRSLLRVGRPVRLLESAAIRVPMVVGWLRPAILLPVSTLTGLTPSHWEAILAHELAHIRRHDYLVNLVQCVAEILLFYHPAAWWASRQIRAEREHCCDDLAVAACGDRLNYARALVALEERWPAPSFPAPAAAGGPLLSRIQRVVGLEPSPRNIARDAVGLAAVMVVSLMMLAGAAADRMRWQADPFAGTRAIEVRHAGRGTGPKTYTIEGKQALASLQDQLLVTGFDNGMAVGSIPTAFLTFHKLDGTSLKVAVESSGMLSSGGGLIRIREGFITALNRLLSATEGRPVDLLQFYQNPPQPQPPIVPASRRSLEAGFTSARVLYAGGDRPPRLRWARITDPAALDEFHKALLIVGQGPVGDMKPRFREFTATCKDGSTFYGQIEDNEHLFAFDVGRFTIDPSFVKALNERLGRMEGRPIDVLSNNSPVDGSAESERALRRRLADVVSIRYRATAERWKFEGVADKPDEVARLIGALEWAEQPVRERRLPAGDFVLEMVTKNGETSRITYLQTGVDDGLIDVGPLGGDLVEVAGLGQVWVDNQWKYRFQQHREDATRAEEARKERVTTREVSRDFPGFLEQVVSVVANYRDGQQQTRWGLPPDRSRRIARALASGKVEELAWAKEQWGERLKDLDARQAGILELAPGLGYSLRLVIVGEREILIPMLGRITFDSSPIGAIRAAIEENPGAAIGLLPLEPAGARKD